MKSTLPLYFYRSTPKPKLVTKTIQKPKPEEAKQNNTKKLIPFTRRPMKRTITKKLTKTSFGTKEELMIKPL